MQNHSKLLWISLPYIFYWLIVFYIIAYRNISLISFRDFRELQICGTRLCGHFVLCFLCLSQMWACLPSTARHPWPLKCVCTHLLEGFIVSVCDYQTLTAQTHLCQSPPTSFRTFCSESDCILYFHGLRSFNVIKRHNWSVCTTMLIITLMLNNIALLAKLCNIW